jgi:peroxiredoxin
MFHKLFFPFGLLVLVLTACTGSQNLGGGSGTTDLEVAPIKGALAPDFELGTVYGETVKLSDFRGQSVLVNFWATWCAPCRIEMPAIQERFETYSPDLQILAVDFAEPLDAVMAFKREIGITFDPLLDFEADVQALYQVRGYPSTYFIDPEGVIQVVHIGLMTEDQLDDFLSQIGIGIPATASTP